MSYSRWSDSEWYTYWLAGTEGKNAVFQVCDPANGSRSIPYSECKTITVQKLEEIFNQHGRDYEELFEYIKEFCLDVEMELLQST